MKPHRTHKQQSIQYVYIHMLLNILKTICLAVFFYIVDIRWAWDCRALMEFLVEGLVSFLGPHQNPFRL